MHASKSDLFVLRTWIKLIIIMTCMLILEITVPIAATFPNIGFPCYFSTIVDYNSLNLTQRNTAKHLTPTLFLETPEMYVYITWSTIVDALVVVYYMSSLYGILKAKKTHIHTMTCLQNWMVVTGNPSVLFLGILRMWTIQLFVHTLSYKHIFLAAFVYAAHLFISILHVQGMVSRNSSKAQFDLQNKEIPTQTFLECVLKSWKPIYINIYMSLLALEMLVFSLSFMMAICNSFYMLVSDAVFGAINLFLILTVIWYLNLELFVARYLKVHIGFYAGVFVGYIILLLPVLRYDKVFVAANLHQAITINITAIPVISLIALLLRAWKLCTSSQKYKYSQLPPKRTSSPKVHKSAIMEPCSSDEEDIL
ncbi:glycoprotein M [Saguinine gammaherpesvirus 1]|uniref:Glycoprotein M n=1 Tax=Saguinine gammaherpesvirus 1 TaxID=2169901 RepID=A0A9Q8QY81_9GAMA|nr:glycoprotein M [Saguinine gammaherpesvirus 1]